MRRLKLCALVVACWLLASPAFAQVAYDGETAQNDALSGETTCSLSHTTAGSDRYALVVIGWGNTALATVSAITYGGTTMGAPLVSLVDGGTDVGVAIYGRANPPTGSTAISITFADAAYGGCAVISFNGVDQVTPTTDTDSAQGNGSGPTLTLTTAADEILVDILQSTGTAVAAGANQTQFVDVDDGTFDVRLQGSYQDGADGGAMTWGSPPANGWAHAAVSLKAATGGGEPAATPKLLLLGVGD